MKKNESRADSSCVSVEYARARLFELADEKYKEFHSGLVPSLSPGTIIGVRMPVLRELAKQLLKESAVPGASFSADDFMGNLPHTYYEENNLHAVFIEKIQDFEVCLKHIRKFLPYVDNWATCDMMNPAVFGKCRDELLPEIMKWTASRKTYTVRFGIGMLMRYYLDESFDVGFLDVVAEIESREYYVNMMRAWYFATALAKQYEKTLPFFEQKKMDKWTHNKGIQKALESFRLGVDRKSYLKTLKIK